MEPKYRTLIQAALIVVVLVVITLAHKAPEPQGLSGPNTVVDARTPH
ncbi:MAG: hypothetical protein JNM31_02395 [Flavobacteriales bacterium]|nr:hypothetical protein [Flavobacteriales bacterium]